MHFRGEGAVEIIISPKNPGWILQKPLTAKLFVFPWVDIVVSKWDLGLFFFSLPY